MKKQVRLFFLLFLIMFLCGCQETNSYENQPVKEMKVETQQVDVPFPSVLSFTALVNDQIIYQMIEESGIQYVKTNVYSGESMALGSIPDFYLNMKQSVLEQPNLYFFATVDDSDMGENVLFRVDLDKLKIERIKHKDGSIPGITIYFYKGKILTLKSMVENNKLVTFIEAYDLQSKKWLKVKEVSLDTNTHQGKVFFGLCANQNNVFILCNEYQGENKIEASLLILDDYFNETKSIKISKEIQDYVLNSFLSDVQSFGDYIYFFNASNYGWLGKINKDKLVEVFKGRNFEISINHSTKPPIFYTRRSTNVYYFDNGGNFIKKNIPVKNDYFIRCILTNDEFCFVDCYADDKKEHAYFFRRDAIDSVILPCE